MKLPYNLLTQTYTKPRIFLCEPDKQRIAPLETFGTNGSFKFNSYSEISFEITRIYNDLITGEVRINPFYDKVEALRLIEIEDFGYFEIQGPGLNSDGIKENKQVTAYSLEYTLSQKYIEDFYTVNGRDEWAGSLEDLWQVKHNDTKTVPSIVLYNTEDKDASILHLILEKVYGWTIGHVDKSLHTMSRDFNVDRMSVYDFIMNEICEKFNCYVVFDTTDNTKNGVINFYAESQTTKFIGDGKTTKFTISPPFSTVSVVSVDGYKISNLNYNYNEVTGVLEFISEAPKDGVNIEVVNGAMDKWETDVFITFENLSREINVSYDAENIKTCLTVTYGDDGTIREVNTGLPYLIDLSYYYNVEWMGQELYDAYTEYLQESNRVQPIFADLSKQLTEWTNKKLHEENRMSLGYVIADSVDKDTVGTYYIRNGVYPNCTYEEIVLNGEGTNDLTKTYYMTDGCNLEDGEDGNVIALYEALSDYVYYYNIIKLKGEDDQHYDEYKKNREEALKEVKSLDDRFKFMADYGYTVKELVEDLKNKDVKEKGELILSFLEKMWNEIGKTPLEQLYLPGYEQTKTNYVTDGWSNKKNENYGRYYVTYIFVKSINNAISERKLLIDGDDKKGIKGYQDEIDTLNSQIVSLSDELIISNFFKKYFDQKYPNDENNAKVSCDRALVRLSAFLREDELHLDDIVEVEIDTLDDIYKTKRDAMEAGRIELQKLCQPQLQFSMSMANIYALHEFDPIIDQFQLGKVIKVAIRPDYIKQSRLLQVNINFDDLSDFSCEFGDLTNLRTQSDIHADLLSQAASAGKQVATNASYWTKGSDTATSTDLKIQNGLLDAATAIKSIDGTQNVVIDKYGIKLQKVDPTTGEVDDKQGWIVNNQFLYSDDGFETTKSVFGEYTVDNETYWGLLAEAVIAGYIEGSTMVGGRLYSSNYSNNPPTGTYLNLETGDFEIGGDRFIYDSVTNDLSLNGVTIDWNTSNPPTTTDIDGLDAYLNQLDGRIQSYSQTNDPSSNWDTEDKKNKHIGDLWFNPTDGLTKRWSGTSWEVVSDSELKELAQSKAKIFTSTPKPPYSKGDLWVQGVSGDIMHCIVGKNKGQSYDASDWTISSKYTNDDALEQFIQGDYASNLDAVNKQIDKKAETWYQSTDPSSNWTTDELKESHVGDLWFDTSKNKSYMYDSSYKWVEANGVPDEVFDAIDGKSTIYVSKPKSQAQGDLLIPNETFTSKYNSTTYNFVEKKIYRCTTKSSTFRPDYWTEVEYTDDTLAKEALAKAEQGVKDAATAYSLADGAKTAASNAEINAKKYADDKDTLLNDAITGAYKKYTDSEISSFDKLVANYLGVGGGTLIGDNYIVSPIIEGGYLNITNTNNKSRVIIDPNNLTGNNFIFQVHNGKEVSVGVDKEGNAIFAGHITAKSGSMGGWFIDNDKLYNYDENYGYSIFQSPNANRISSFAIGITETDFEKGEYTNAYFRVSRHGNLVLKGKTDGDESSGGILYCYDDSDVDPKDEPNEEVKAKVRVLTSNRTTINNVSYFNRLTYIYPNKIYMRLIAQDSNKKNIVRGGSIYLGYNNSDSVTDDDGKKIAGQPGTYFKFSRPIDIGDEGIKGTDGHVSLIRLSNNTDKAGAKDLHVGVNREYCYSAVRNIYTKGRNLSFFAYGTTKSETDDKEPMYSGEIKMYGRFTRSIFLDNGTYLRGMRSGYTNAIGGGEIKEGTASHTNVIAYVSNKDNVVLGHANNTNSTYVRSKNSVYLSCNGSDSSSSRYVIELAHTEINEEQADGTFQKKDRGVLRPSYNDGKYSYTNLGSPSYKWRYVYAQYGSIQTSDRNLKKDIECLNDKYIQAFDLLEPVSYRFLDGDRKHIGFIAQDVEDAFAKNGLTSMDFGGICKDIKTTYSEEDGKEIVVLDENKNPVYMYSLNYTEFIALNTAKIKQLEQRLNQAIDIIDKQQEIIEELKNKVL